MRRTADINIVELREIADRKWDALTSIGRSSLHTDRYDRFLAKAVELLCDGASDAEVGDYLVDVEIECLGLDTGGGIRERSQAFARAIREYVDQCSREQLHPTA